MTSFRLLLCVLLLGACEEELETDDICSTRVDALTYESWGKGFLRTHCNGCHSSITVPEHRKGAPPTVNFDTYRGTMDFAERIQIRVLATDNKMPAGGGPTSEEKAMLEEWIQCSVLPDKDELAGESP